MSVIFGIIGILLCIAILFIMNYWLPILLGILGIILLTAIIYAIIVAVENERLKQIVSARVFSRQPIVETVSEKTGFTRSYGRYYSYHEHFRDKDVVTGHRVSFSVEYQNGERDTITCKEGGRTYRKLNEIALATERRNKINPAPKEEVQTPRQNSSPEICISLAQPSATAPKATSRLETVRKNLTVDEEFFRRHGMGFKCNLVAHYDSLQLNYELSNTKSFASKIEKDTDLTIKANVYDASGNLLCIEEAWAEYSQLRGGYAADYFYFSSDTIVGAHSMKVYAVDPADEYDDMDEDDE